MIHSANSADKVSDAATMRFVSGTRFSSRKLQLVVILSSATVMVSICSHLLVAWLKIETRTGTPWSVGPSNGKPMAFMAGSSLAGDGISWKRISIGLDQKIGGWGVAGASPCEMEVFQRKAPDTKTTFIVVSAYDLNEASLSDFRADVVPLSNTIKELFSSNSQWEYSKRVLSQYPTKWLRTLFPTVGRSRGVMGELHEKLSKLISPTVAVKSEAGPSLSFAGDADVKEYKTARISNWSPGETLRKLAAMRLAFRGDESFDGLKRRAFERMLRYAEEKGRAIVIVLPVSPVYAKEFLTPKTADAFEASLAQAQHGAPGAQWIRLDRLPTLQSNDNYWDLVHMNPNGQQMATDVLLARLKQIASQ